jgi:hypothetical protein
MAPFILKSQRIGNPMDELPPGRSRDLIGQLIQNAVPFPSDLYSFTVPQGKWSMGEEKVDPEQFSFQLQCCSLRRPMIKFDRLQHFNTVNNCTGLTD